MLLLHQTKAQRRIQVKLSHLDRVMSTYYLNHPFICALKHVVVIITLIFSSFLYTQKTFAKATLAHYTIVRIATKEEFIKEMN